MYPACAPTASPAINVPSITECGSCSKISRSLHVPGSLSSPLHKIYLGLADCLGTNDHFSPVLNPAPAQSRVLDLIDDRVRLHGKRLPHGFVAVKLDIAVDVRSALSKALRNDA